MENKSFTDELQQIQLKKRAEGNVCAKTAERIEQILQAKGMNHKELAALLGKRESEISRWMSGKHNFTISTIADIEFALGESIIEYPAYSETLIAAEPTCTYSTSDSVRATCIGLLRETDNIDILSTVQRTIESLIKTVDMKNNSKTNEFIKSIQLKGGSKVPADVNGIECLIEEKYLHR